MKTNRRIVVTKSEVLRVLGVKKVTLSALEDAAGITGTAGRIGYTGSELELLRSALKKIVTHEG